MKIIECYIENFGKISKQKFAFTDGFNCISGENGIGKTTLAAFIKTMLYGFNDTKKLSLEENDRKHYLPWNGGMCGGSLTFSVDGRVYRIERSLGSKAANDSCVLYDTATGRVCNDFGEVPGEVIFGIDADGFERTVFLSERALTPQSDNKSISAKLSDLVGCDGDIGSMDEAMKIIENQRKFYYKKGGSGELSDIASRIEDITRRLDSLSEVEVELAKTLSVFPERVNAAINDYEPSVVTRYILDLCAAFNRFYHECSIVNCEDEALRNSRIALTRATNQILRTALHLICLQSPEKI